MKNKLFEKYQEKRKNSVYFLYLATIIAASFIVMEFSSFSYVISQSEDQGTGEIEPIEPSNATNQTSALNTPTDIDKIIP